MTTMPHYELNRIRDGYRGKIWSREKIDGMDIHRLYVHVPRDKSHLVARTISLALWNMFSAAAGALICRADIIFVPSPPLTNGLAGYVIGLVRGVPFIYNLQDIHPDVAIRLGIIRDRYVIKALKAIESFIYARASAISVISDGFKQNLLAKGVLDPKLRVIPNFVDTEHIRPLARRNPFSSAQWLDDRFVVLFAGNLGLSQGLERILDAAMILDDVHDIVFLMVGNGASKGPLVEQARRMRLRNVKFRPFFSYDDVPFLYASSDVCLVPLKKGLTEESVPSKVYSILAAGRPLIASVDEGSDTWRLVRDAECGLCVQPEDPQALADAVLSLYHDRERGSRLGSNGRRHVEENFSRQKIAGRYAALFEEVRSRRTK
jgi:colanic acid biosynthesis glycosyl transferase WcaI